MTFSFQYPQALWLLLLLPLFVLLFIVYESWKRKRMKQAGDALLIKQLSPGHSFLKSVIKTCLLLFAFACGCIALANPRIPDQATGEAREGIDIVIALDISYSMLATDIEPNRLERAKQMVSKLIDKLQDDRISLVLFAGYAYIRFPLTFDHASSKMLVSISDPENITFESQGTNISDALIKGALAFGDETERFKTIIVITDGETHDEKVEETITKIKEKGIMVNTIGIGSMEGTTIADSAGRSRTNTEGQVIVSKLNEPLLKNIATATNGVYVHLQGSDEAVNTIMSQYAQIEKKALADMSLFTYHSYYSWLAIPMLLLILAEIFIPDRKKIKS